MKSVEIYVGSMCRGNPGDGGWAAVLRMGRHEKVLSGAEARTTANRLELLALSAVLQILIEPCAVTVHASSRFLGDGFARWTAVWEERGWSATGARPVHNGDVWHALIDLAQAHEMTFAPVDSPVLAQVMRLAEEAAAER